MAQNTDNEQDTKKHLPDKLGVGVVRRMSLFPSAEFTAKANLLCEQITEGMKGLDREHNFESYEDLIIAILNVKAKEFSPYA